VFNLLFLAISSFAGSDRCLIAGGSFGIVAAACTSYIAVAGICTKETTFIQLSEFAISSRREKVG
jgi:succinate-acetate transporter protein